LVADATELWVKATKNGAGQYVIPSNQYMGKLSIMGYVFPYYWTAVDAEDNMVDAVFSFDAENSRFTTAQTQVLNGAEDKLEPYITFTEVVIEKMVEVAATPADPTMEKVVFDVKNAPGNNSLNCSLAIVGTNDEVLNTSKLFYTIWLRRTVSRNLMSSLLPCILKTSRRMLLRFLTHMMVTISIKVVRLSILRTTLRSSRHGLRSVFRASTMVLANAISQILFGRIILLLLVLVHLLLTSCRSAKVLGTPLVASV
jgi:hypothetical protein